MASAVYLYNHSALEWANDCRAEGWPEATAGVHLNEGLVRGEVHWAKDFWGYWSCWSREGIGVGPSNPKEDTCTLRMFGWQLPDSRAHKHNTGCNAILCSDAEICLITVTIMSILDTAHCISKKWPRPRSQWITVNLSSECWYGRKCADGSCFYLVMETTQFPLQD